MRNRTKNADLRRTIERTQCLLESSSANALTIENANQYNNYKTAQRAYPSEFDGEDPFNHNDLGNHLDDFKQKPNKMNREMVQLFNIDVNHLPCESLTEPTELPLSRESVGMDLGRVFQFSNGARASQGNLIAVCTLIIAYFLATS